MNDKTIGKTQATQMKKAYVKPVISKVRLVAEEAVLALCKLNTGVMAACRAYTVLCSIANQLD